MESVRIKQNKEALYRAATLLKDLNEHIVYVGGRIVGAKEYLQDYLKGEDHG